MHTANIYLILFIGKLDFFFTPCFGSYLNTMNELGLLRRIYLKLQMKSYINKPLDSHFENTTFLNGNSVSVTRETRVVILLPFTLGSTGSSSKIARFVSVNTDQPLGLGVEDVAPVPPRQLQSPGGSRRCGR